MGFIYIMTNPGLKDMVKIGYAKDVEKRRKKLRGTAVPYPYEVYATYETRGELDDKKLHRMIDSINADLRVSKDREFYVMKPEDAYELLEAVAAISGTLKKLKRNKKSKNDSNKIKKPPVNFKKCGIPIGAKLEYIEDPKIIVTVFNDRKVLYNDKITSLSAISKSIKGYPSLGSQFFSYKGKRICDIAKETQWKE